jgi:hypothetical protein
MYGSLPDLVRARAGSPDCRDGGGVSLKGLLSPPISGWLLSRERLLRRRARAERARLARGSPLRVDYFHQPDDPYSLLAAGALLTPGKVVKSGELWAGRPAKFLRGLTAAEIAGNRAGAAGYARLAQVYRTGG